MTEVSPGRLAALQEAVLTWAPSGWRDLPWRRTRDPWAVLVSEIMLQQTQVARVLPAWRSFMTEWPTPAACATASPADVVRAWAGLGYNRRALNLRRCATQVVVDHAGAVPDRLEALRALPGVGEYTARAVLAFAFGRDVGVLDTNAGRVVSRAVAGRPLRRPDAQRLLDQLVPDGLGWTWNQTVLDLGSSTCTARAPSCGSCPLEAHCVWRGEGGPDPATASAATSRPQRPFRGSDREGRGRLLHALRLGSVAQAAVPQACGWPEDAGRGQRVAAQLVAEGFATLDAGVLSLSQGG